MDIVANARKSFFDTGKVTTALDKATKKALSKFGAFVRQRAKSSIRSRKQISQPGQPPSNHAGHLKRLIFFQYSADEKTVVIGPVPFRRGIAPSLLESGGVRISKNGRPLKYRQRPFMKPAFDKELSLKPAEFWKDEAK
jgi:hypothetical protein